MLISWSSWLRAYVSAAAYFYSHEKTTDRPKGIVMRLQRTRSSGLSVRLLVSGLCLLLTLFLVACGSPYSSASTQHSAPTTGSTGNTTPTTTDQTSTSTPTAAPTRDGTMPTATATPTGPVPFMVTGVAWGAWPGDHTGACGNHTFFTASALIYAPAHTPGGTVTYTWLRSDTSTIAHNTVTFAAGTTSRTVTSIWSLNPSQGNGSAYTVALKTLSPEVFTTAQITYHHTCQRQVQRISVTVSPNTGCNSVTKTFTLSATLYVSPGPSNVLLTSTWKRSDGTSGTTTTGIVPQSTTTVTLSDSWTLTAPITTGTYWEELAVTTPNGFPSNQAAFTITKC